MNLGRERKLHHSCLYFDSLGFGGWSYSELNACFLLFHCNSKESEWSVVPQCPPGERSHSKERDVSVKQEVILCRVTALRDTNLPHSESFLTFWPHSYFTLYLKLNAFLALEMKGFQIIMATVMRTLCLNVIQTTKSFLPSQLLQKFKGHSCISIINSTVVH